MALLLHGLLLWAVARHAPRPAAQADGPAMLWLKVSAAAVRTAPATPLPQSKPQPQPRAARPRAAEPGRRAAAPVVQAQAVAEAVAPLAAPADALAAAPAETVLSMAKRGLGKIDQDLRKQYKPARLSASEATAMQRLAKGIEEAHQAAPNKWYQAATIEDVTPPGDDARKIYRIKTALGTYCVRYKDKNRPGVDQGQANLGEALIGACPHMF